MSITRRDFLNTTALTIAAGLTPAQQLAAQPSPYPPAPDRYAWPSRGLLRDRACVRPRRRRSFRSTACRPMKATTSSWSAAASAGSPRRGTTARAKASARILILDNHDDFGGHAKRNEFTLNGRQFIGYGGSESIQSPRALLSPVATKFLRDLGVGYPSVSTPPSIAVFTRRWVSHAPPSSRAKRFGRDALVRGDALETEDEENPDHAPKANPRAKLVADFPMSEAGKKQFLALFGKARRSACRKNRNRKVARCSSAPAIAIS